MQYSYNPSVPSEKKLSIQKLGLSSTGMKVFELLYLKMQEDPAKYRVYFHFSTIQKQSIDLTKFKEALYELLAKNIIYRSTEDFTYFVNVNLINIRINEDCLAILKYKDTKKLEVDYKEVVNNFLKEISDFKLSLIKNDETYKYTINDLEKLRDFLKSTNLQQLNMKYRYCTSLSGVYQGFTVNLGEEIKTIDDLINFIELNILNYDLNNVTDDDCKQMNSVLNNIIGTNDKKLINNDVDINELIDYISKIIIYRYCKSLQLWATAFSIQKTYKECDSNQEILFFSHRINGWSQPVCSLNKKLSAEYKTNFGYGRSSYFYVKLKYDNIEIIPFCDLVRYEYASFFEINQYSKKYNLEDNSWKQALVYLADAYNILIDSEEQFIKKYMIGEIDNLIFELGSLMEKEHFEFVDEDTGDIKVKEFKGANLIIFRAKKITSSLDFISKIKEYKNIMKVDLAIRKIEEFNVAIKIILENEIDILNENLQNTELKIDDIRPKFLELKKVEDDYQKKKRAIKEKIISKHIELKSSENYQEKKKIKEEISEHKETKEEIEKIFLSECPEYKDFCIEYEPIETEWLYLIGECENTKNILEYLNIYHEKVIEYFKQTKLSKSG